MLKFLSFWKTNKRPTPAAILCDQVVYILIVALYLPSTQKYVLSPCCMSGSNSSNLWVWTRETGDFRSQFGTSMGSCWKSQKTQALARVRCLIQIIKFSIPVTYLLSRLDSFYLESQSESAGLSLTRRNSLRIRWVGSWSFLQYILSVFYLEVFQSGLILF